MIAKVIHFGPDDCHRQLVLQRAGYTVLDCRTLPQLRSFLVAENEIDAVLMSESGDLSPSEAAVFAREHSPLPVILFRNTNSAVEESGFELVVHCLTPPETWLSHLDALIERARADEGTPAK